MKLQMEDAGASLVLKAESPADLDWLWRATDDMFQGRFRHARLERVPVSELGFDHALQGLCYACGEGEPDAQGIYTVGAVLRLRLDWVTYAEPESPAQQLRANTASRLGHGLLDALKLVRCDA